MYEKLEFALIAVAVLAAYIGIMWLICAVLKHGGRFDEK